MFNLEHAIKQWLRLFSKYRAFDHGPVREMEQHLRDHIDDLIAEGHDEQKAFEIAVKAFGEVPVVAREEFQNLKSKPSLRSFVHTAMMKNFYFTAIRHFYKHWNYFTINITGLAIGITGFVLISLYILNELSYDRFHADYKNTYRVSNLSVTSAGTTVDAATAHEPLAKTLLADYPEVRKATRAVKGNSMIVGWEGEYYSEERILFADSNFLRVFDFKMVKGNREIALVNPRSMVLTESHAKKYFGDRDPIGRHISVEGDSILYDITGVVSLPANSHIQFDMLGSINSNPIWNDGKWIGEDVHTYVTLAPDTDLPAFEEKIQSVMAKYVGPEIEYYTGHSYSEYLKAGNRPSYYLIPIADIHLRSNSTRELEPGGNVSYVYIYALIGIIILFIAIFNFVNLATVQSTSRAKEVGVRKVIGSSKAGLVYQFMFESVLVSIFASVVAGLLVRILYALFHRIGWQAIGFQSDNKLHRDPGAGRAGNCCGHPCRIISCLCSGQFSARRSTQGIQQRSEIGMDAEGSRGDAVLCFHRHHHCYAGRLSTTRIPAVTEPWF